MNVGIIGCGAISSQYMIGLKKNKKEINILACADKDENKSEFFAKEYNINPLSVEALLMDKDIDIIVNLTPPSSHFDISLKSLENGKHVFSEKPVSLTIEEGKKLYSTMKKNNVYLFSAPDTYLGPAFKKAQKIISSNKIGKIIGGSASFTSHGVEGWHPNPSFYYKRGGGPLFDMGPYYLTSLIKIFGNVEKVISYSQKTFDTRKVENPDVDYNEIKVDIDTHYFALLKFESDIVVDFQVSFDIWKPYDPKLEIYGENSSLKLADPNNYDGEISIFNKETYEWESIYTPVDNENNYYRGLGVVEMVKCITKNNISRENVNLPFHVLDVMCTLDSYQNYGIWANVEEQF